MTIRNKYYKTICYVFFMIIFFIFSGGCGRKGDPLPPDNRTQIINNSPFE